MAEASSERVSSGESSLKMVDNDPVRSLEVFSSRIPITEEQTYRARAQVYVEAKSVRVYVRFLKSGSSADLSNGSFNFLANTVGSWNTVEIEAFAPKGADQAQITFYYGGSGTGTISYIDDVRFDRKKEASSTLQPPYGSAGIDLGEPVKIGLSQAAAIGVGPDGTLEQYITSVASPSAFTVVDALTGISKFSERVPGATDPIWGIARGSDGNYYFTSTGKLYRYVTAERRIENLGTNPTGNTTMWDVKASSDGKIYGSTSHTGNMGKVFEYDIATSTFKDLGVVKEGETSARGLGVTDRYLYVGTGTKAGLVRIDRHTGEKLDLTVPGVTGRTGGTLTEVAVYNGLVFVNSGTELYVLKDGTYEHVRTIPYQSKISPPSPVNPDLMYYKMGEEFFSYNMATDTITKIAAIQQPLPDSAFKFSEWVTPVSGPYAGQSVLFSMAAFGETFLFEPNKGQYSTVLAQLDVNAAQINVLEYNNGKLFASGFQRGMSIYDIATNRIVYDFPTFHQAESIGFNGDVAYFGTYTGAKMYRMDLSQPIQYNDYGWGNPGIAWDIGDDQNRPFAFASGGEKLFVGTFPASGFPGALTVMQEIRDDSGTVTGVTGETFRNLMKDQSIIGLDYKDGKVYGSTTVYSGSGSVNPAPLEKEAKVFVFNPDTNQIERSVTPKVPGVTGEVKIIGELSVGPDGLIWGIQDAFVNTTVGYDASIFALDPATLEVVKAKKITQSPYSTSKYRPYYIRWGNDGLLYTTIGRKLFAIDPVTLAAKDLLPGKTVNLMTMADNGDIYYTDNTKLLKLPIAIDVSKPSVDHSRLTPGKTTRVSSAYTLVDRSQTDPDATTVTYVSSDPSVLTIAGDGVTAVGKGTASIRAVVRSGGIKVTGPALEVEVYGSEPSLSSISDLTLDEDTSSGLIPFTVEDYDTPDGSLTVTAVSSNEALIPGANIRLGGTGSNRTIRLVPAANQFGSSSIQLTVTDGTYSASTSFMVHVLAVNDAPTISQIADQTVAPGKRTIEVPFTIGDVDSPLSGLTVTASSSDATVVSQSSLVITGNEAERKVRITTEPGRPGSSTRITLTVSDSVDSTTRSFTLTVTPDGRKDHDL
ncbi:hypothetical protein [Paenibacillus sp. HJGM_3]|uniref:hypothetical protein n=1 Tax=Paenibacillus sp. HJGM_3 TaxID=3379816 RepID=UPI00385FBF39